MSRIFCSCELSLCSGAIGQMLMYFLHSMLSSVRTKLSCLVRPGSKPRRTQNAGVFIRLYLVYLAELLKSD